MRPKNPTSNQTLEGNTPVKHSILNTDITLQSFEFRTFIERPIVLLFIIYLFKFTVLMQPFGL
jgi:hypothetical protein